MKFTVGDTVRIVENNSGHIFEIGDECLIMNRPYDSMFALARMVGSLTESYIVEDDAQLIKEVVRTNEAVCH